MRKFKYFWITLVALTPLTASKVNAQSFGAPIDILGPVQEDLIREVRQNPRRRQQSQPTFPQPSSSTNKLFDKGLQLFKQGDYRAAIAVFDAVISRNPNFAAYTYRGAARLGLRNYQGALEDINYAIRLNPQWFVSYQTRGVALYELRDYRASLENINQAMRLETFPEGYIARSAVHLALGNYQESIEDANRGIRLNPELAVAYAVRGAIQSVLGNKQRALEDANRAVALGQTGVSYRVLAEIYSRRGEIHYDLGNVEQAISDAQRAISINPEDDRGMLILAVFLYTKGVRQESFQFAEKAIRINGNLADIKYLKETGMSSHLLSDTQTFFNSPQILGLLSAIR
jgi:tetratricopeptide (TPR) repeat protein